MSRQGIGGQIGAAWLVHNLVLKTHELGVKLQLSRCAEPLIYNMHQATLVSEDHKLAMLEISPPLIDCHEDCEILFLVCGKPPCLSS